ncbi:MAG: glycosyltransferase family 2 protein [Candidatus Dormibacteraceae bacterium]
MSEQRPLVSAIVLNFNGASYLTDCLSSLVSQTYPKFEVLVADNGSTDDSKTVADDYAVRWVQLERNFGLAHATNLAVSHAKGSLLLFVNNDMRFDPSFIEALVEPFLVQTDLFATDARQLDWSGDHEVHLASRLRRRPLSATVGGGGGLLPRHDVEQIAVSSGCDAVQASGAGMAVRRSMFEELAGFDPAFLFSWEDTDICWRAWLRGWRTMFVPQAVCWHHVSMSAVSPAGSWYRYRGALGGKILFAMKHLPVEDAVLTGALVLAGGIKELVRGRPCAAWRRLRVSMEFGRLLPAALKARRRAYREAGTSPRRHLRRLCSIGWSDSSLASEGGGSVVKQR